MSKLGKDLIAGMKEAVAYMEGRPARGTRVHVSVTPNVKKIRKTLKMSQSEFARAFSIPLNTVQNWEQGLRRPDAPAAAYLRVIARHPKTVKDAVAQ